MKRKPNNIKQEKEETTIRCKTDGLESKGYIDRPVSTHHPLKTHINKRNLVATHFQMRGHPKGALRGIAQHNASLQMLLT